MRKTSVNRTIVKLAIAVGIIATLIIGGYFGLRQYQNYLANKIYSVDENASMADFDFSVTKAEFKPVELPLNKEIVSKYGGIDKQEDCSELSSEGAWFEIDGKWQQIKYGISPKIVCEGRNEARTKINEYSNSSDKLSIEYKILATQNVDVNSLKISVMPDSGRDVKQKVKSLNSNDFFGYCMREEIYQSGAPGRTYNSGCIYNPITYTPYKASDIGLDINKGLERTGSIDTDIRKSEKNIDIKITYKDQTRIIRIHR